jgi:hypothetical protein
MDEQLQQRYSAMARDAGEDELLRHMFETMSAASTIGESYYRGLSELRDRHPNKWALCRDERDPPTGERHLVVLGPFDTQREAVECWNAMPADRREGFTVEFLEVRPWKTVKISTPFFRGIPIPDTES